MRFFDRLRNGWDLGKTSLRTIAENPSLMFFPVVSGVALILVTLSFAGGGLLLFGDDVLAAVSEESVGAGMNMMTIILTFIFYLVTYFVIVFFNVGLVYCARRILEGEEVTVGDGIRFAQQRTAVILSWAFLAATVGLILKMIQENAGSLGKFITGLIGMVWGIATFFVVPVLAFEDVNPIEAVKRSASIMKDKWGESLGANFSLNTFTFLGILLIALPLGFILGFLIHPIVGVVVGFTIFLIVITGVSAASMVFLAAAYQHVNDEPIGYFEGDILDDIFINK